MQNSLLLLLLIFGLSLNAQIQFNSFQEVLDYADKKAFILKSAALNEQIALSQKKEAKLDLLPSINVSLGYNDNITIQPTLVPAQIFNPAAEEGTVEELTFGTKYTYSRGIQAQWDVFNMPKMHAVKTADFQLKESQINTEINRFNTYNQLASTYYSILLTLESVRIYEENVQVSQSIFQRASKKFEDGIISKPDLNRAEIKTRQNKRNRELAQSNLNQLYLQMQSQLNVDQSIVVVDSPENFMLTNQTIQQPHPEVRLQEVTLEKQQSLLKQTKSIQLPTFSLFYQNNKNWATDQFMDFSNANELPQQFFGVQLNWSGLFGFSNKQKINQSKLQLEMQQQRLENTRLIKQQEDELLQLQLNQASGQLKENKELLNLQEENDSHTENQYESGLISLDQRLDQYDDLLAVQDQYLQSLAAFTLAQYKIYIRQISY